MSASLSQPKKLKYLLRILKKDKQTGQFMKFMKTLHTELQPCELRKKTKKQRSLTVMILELFGFINCMLGDVFGYKSYNHVTSFQSFKFAFSESFSGIRLWP